MHDIIDIPPPVAVQGKFVSFVDGSVYLERDFSSRGWFFPEISRSSEMIYLNGMAESAVSWTEDLKVGSLIPAVARSYLIYSAQKD